MTETILSHLLTWKDYDLYCNQPLAGDFDYLASLLGGFHVVHLYLGRQFNYVSQDAIVHSMSDKIL